LVRGEQRCPESERSGDVIFVFVSLGLARLTNTETALGVKAATIAKGDAAMTNREDDSRLIFSAITHYRRWVVMLIPQIVPDVEVSFQQLNVLYQVRVHQASMAEMARNLGVAPTVITGLVDRLEARGLIRREAHASDRRRIQLVLTERGHEISVLLEEAVAERIDRQVSMFDPDQQDQLRAGLELLEQLTADLEARALHADFGATGQSSENE
jgi:DNA-binding MarR family transcriptional regulator